MSTLFAKGSTWAADRESDLLKSRVVAWRVAAVACVCALALAIALATLTPLRRTIPYLVRVDSDTGAVEVLQSFDNRLIGKQELMNKYWATQYVQSREQYNWWLVGGDYDRVVRLTDPAIVGEYAGQFDGPNALDKVFGEVTERKIKILSVTPAPTVRDQMVVRFERTTLSKGAVIEQPTTFVVTMTFRYRERTTGPEIDLVRNPMGFQVYAYRRDAEVGRESAAASGAATGVSP